MDATTMNWKGVLGRQYSPSLLWAYFRMSKPVVWGVLVVTAILGYLIAALLAGQFSATEFVLMTVALAAGTAGCESVTNYIDLPLDSVMARTFSRPLPTGEVQGTSALALGAMLLGVALALSAFLGLLFVGLMAFGILDNILIYSYWLKRRSSQSILWGGFSGAVPILFGALAANPAGWVLGLALFAFVYLWTPPHIWAIAAEYREDYARAGVPMLPVVTERPVWGSATAVFTGALILDSGIILYLARWAWVPLFLLAVLGAALITLLAGFLRDPDFRAKPLFHYLNLYLIGGLAVVLFAAWAPAPWW
jgi:protoheme IX farnesyltransferase